MTSGKPYSPEEMWAAVRRRKWLMIVPFIVICIATLIITRALPDRYRTYTLILVVPQRVPESYVRSTVTARIEDRLGSISQQILSRTRLERIISEFDLYRDARQMRPMEDVVNLMRKDIDVEVVKGDSFRISYTGDDPKTVMGVTQRLASLFIDENLRDRAVLAEEAYQFLGSQLDEARRALVAQERKLEEYRRTYSGQLPSQVDSNLRMIQNAQMQIQTLNEATARDVDRRLIVERAIADLSAAGGTGEPTPADSKGTSALAQLETARSTLREMESRLKPQHPDIVRLKAAIADLTVQAQAEPRSGQGSPEPSESERARQSRLSEMRAERDNLNRQLARREQAQRELRAVVDTYQARVEAAPARETELIQLTRDYDTQQRAYVGLLVKQEEAKISANLERKQAGEQFRVLDPARIPVKPFSPNRVRLNVLGSLAGLMFGLALVALLEFCDSTLKTGDDVLRTLGLPVLALVPLMRNEYEALKARRVRRLVAVASGAVIVVAAAFIAWKLQF